MSEQLLDQLCMAFNSMNTPDNIARSQAESYLKQVRKTKIDY